MIYELKDKSAAIPLFGAWEETLIWSCLQGVMGKLYADDPKNPSAAMAILAILPFLPESQMQN